MTSATSGIEAGVHIEKRKLHEGSVSLTWNRNWLQKNPIEVETSKGGGKPGQSAQTLKKTKVKRAIAVFFGWNRRTKGDASRQEQRFKVGPSS